MPEPQADEQVVSDATETADDTSAESSSTDTQTQSDASTERPDYRRLLKEDPDLRAVFDSEIQRAISKRERAALRAAARAAADSADKDSALEITRRVADETDDDDDDVSDPAFSVKAQQVQPHLERLLRLDAQGMSHNEFYVELHKQHGKAEMDRRYADDPVAFLDWVEDQIEDLRLDRKLKKVAPSLAEAMATDQVNRQLQKVGAPLTGGAGAGNALTLEAYEAMTFEQRQKLRKENPQAIDKMVARYSK